MIKNSRRRMELKREVALALIEKRLKLLSNTKLPIMALLDAVKPKRFHGKANVERKEVDKYVKYLEKEKGILIEKLKSA